MALPRGFLFPENFMDRCNRYGNRVILISGTPKSQLLLHDTEHNILRLILNIIDQINP